MRLVGSLGPAPGSPPTRPRLLPPLPGGCSVDSVCQYGITTPPVACVAKFWTFGVITPSLAAAGATESFATTPSATWCAPQSPKSPLSPLSWKSLVSSSPRGRRTPEAPTSISTSRALSPDCRRSADVWVPRGVSGFAEAWDVSALFGHPDGG